MIADACSQAVRLEGLGSAKAAEPWPGQAPGAVQQQRRRLRQVRRQVTVGLRGHNNQMLRPQTFKSA